MSPLHSFTLIHQIIIILIYINRKLLAAEIAKMAFDYEINDIAIKASEFVVMDKWESRNASEMIL